MAAIPIDEQVDNYIVSQLTQHYGDLLKVSRSRGITQTLPQLRKYISENDFIIEQYHKSITSEIEGQGLENSAVIKALQDAQLEAFRNADHKNNTVYSSEIKKLITEGKVELDSNGDVAVVNKAKKKLSLAMAIINNPLEVNLEELTNEDCTEAREILVASFATFSKWAFELQMGFKFQMQDFHNVIFEVCQEVVDGKRDRLIVTIPPRHSKTQILSIFLPLYSFCHNPGSHNIITSYADDVVAESSGYIRTIMLTELFMKVFPALKIDASKRSLERWGTTKGGVLHAVPSGGKLTGKGAGSLTTAYSGCFVVDDIIKPKDAYSNTVRSEINDRYDNTFMSRLANDGVINDADGNEIKCPRTPMCIIMQRVHDEDLVGYLLRGKSSDSYDWLNIPAVIEPGVGSQGWYDKLIEKQAYTHAKPVLFNLQRKEARTALWPARKSLESLDAMKKASPYTFNSQYMGDPTAQGTGLIQDAWWQEYDVLPKDQVIRTFMTADTASTKEDYSDYSVLCLWAVMRNRDMYLADVMLGKFETPELKIELIKFWNKHNRLDLGFPCMLPVAMHMEDKSSGQFLNQQFTRDGDVRVMPVPKDKTSGDKVARFLNTVPYFAQGRLWFPREHEHKAHIKREIMGMTGLGSSTGHDDVVDNVSDAVAIEYSGSSANYENWVN
ncbi:phage terminase large subunit [Pseudomonas laurylsulfatiphila]|uniref:phage terminase large subunit n=1 Tax=Pseudomonas laurylsulfatiphila TaxID=2011015 RepID=UPI003D1C64A9